MEWYECWTFKYIEPVKNHKQNINRTLRLYCDKNYSYVWTEDNDLALLVCELEEEEG